MPLLGLPRGSDYKLEESAEAVAETLLLNSVIYPAAHTDRRIPQEIANSIGRRPPLNLPRAFVEASLREQDPQATEATIRKGLFLRFYGHEFDAPTRGKILAAIERTAQQGCYSKT